MMLNKFLMKSMNPNLSVSTPELNRKFEQLKIKLNGRAISISLDALKLFGVNFVSLMLMNCRVNWIDPHYLPIVSLMAPYIKVVYSIKLLGSLGLSAMMMYPLAVGYERIVEEVQRRRPTPLAMDDLR